MLFSFTVVQSLPYVRNLVSPFGLSVLRRITGEGRRWSGCNCVYAQMWYTLQYLGCCFDMTLFFSCHIPPYNCLKKWTFCTVYLDLKFSSTWFCEWLCYFYNCMYILCRCGKTTKQYSHNMWRIGKYHPVQLDNSVAELVYSVCGFIPEKGWNFWRLKCNNSCLLFTWLPAYSCSEQLHSLFWRESVWNNSVFSRSELF